MGRDIRVAMRDLRTEESLTTQEGVERERERERFIGKRKAKYRLKATARYGAYELPKGRGWRR